MTSLTKEKLRQIVLVIIPLLAVGVSIGMTIFGVTFIITLSNFELNSTCPLQVKGTTYFEEVYFVICGWMLLTSIVFCLLVLPCTPYFRKNIYRLDLSQELIDRVTQLDIPLLKPKSTIGGLVTLCILILLPAMIANQIISYTNRSDNYQITASSPMSPLRLRMTAFNVKVDCDRAQSQLLNSLQVETTCVGDCIRLSCKTQSIKTLSNFKCYPGKGTNDGNVVEFEISMLSIRPRALLDDTYCGSCSYIWNFDFGKGDGALDVYYGSWYIQSMIYDNQENWITDCDASSQTFMKKPGDIFYQAAFPSSIICSDFGFGVDLTIRTVPRGICSADGGSINVDMSSYEIHLEDLVKSGKSGLQLKIDFENSDGAIGCTIDKSSVTDLIVSIIGLIGAAVGEHALLKELFTFIFDKMKKKKEKDDSTSPDELVGLINPDAQSIE